MGVDDETRGTRAAAGDATADGRDSAYDSTAPGSQALTGDALTIVPAWGASAFAALPAPGYQIGELIGRGGMGEVVAAQDQRIGREVAVKRIRAKAPSADAVTRFLREARIQARLDHPAIVPVYEMGTDEAGLPYFTMKRLSGETLAKRLSERAPIQPMLRAFVDVCLAVQLAHSRGVIHRDLKPSNIMLGDYGEVYVLDWGVARVLTDRSRTTTPVMLAETDDDTTAGAILGTPGYMSPEQVRGSDAGRAADVYALGSILFEILSGEPLHPRGEAALASTLTRPQEAPATRVPESRNIPPELDAVCFDALAEDAAARPTARELADRVQAYLDGDRDLERRRALADAQLQSAQDALASHSPTGRADAMRRAGRALALDPESAEAAQLVSRLMLEPPAAYPPDLQETLAEEERETTRDRGRKAFLAFGAVLALTAVLTPFLHVRNWTLLGAFTIDVVLLMALSMISARTGVQRLAAVLTVNCVGIMIFSRIASPFILTPIVLMGLVLSFSSSPQLLQQRWLLIGWTVVTVMLPIVLELVHVIPQTWRVHGGLIQAVSEMYDLDGTAEEVALIVANLGLIIIGTMYAIAVNSARRKAQRDLQIQAWHLRQLLPSGKRPWQTNLRS
jgi:eukaryotic-like serine/threonine-protein kinase